MSKMTVKQIFEYLGATREQIVEATAPHRRLPVASSNAEPVSRPRPVCLICGNRINALNCQPVRQIKRIIRVRKLTPAEATQNQAVIDQVIAEIPPAAQPETEIQILKTSENQDGEISIVEGPVP